MINDRAQTVPSLLDAVRALARGDDLDTTLAQLCSQACAASHASTGVILLYDDDTGALVLPGGDGDTIEIPEAGSVDAVDPTTRVLRDRVAVWGVTLPSWLAALLDGGSRASIVPSRGSIVPLVREDQAGATVEGLLALAIDSGGSDRAREADADPDADGRLEMDRETVLAIADLAAVAIHQERLRSTSAEGVAYLERLSRTDPLTGLADRNTFAQMLELELARATRLGTALAVAVFDIDGLAAINEQHGAGVGDDLLRSVAATLADKVRLVDTVARIGPDEFGVIAPGDPGGTVARRVRDAVSELPAIGGSPASVRAGVAHHPQDGTSGADLLDAAHRAISRARIEGAGTVVGLRGMPDLEASASA